MVATEDEEPQIISVGDEELNEEAVAHINRTLKNDETPVASAGFDFETKVLVITDQRVLITAENGVALILNHDDIDQMRRDGRTLIIKARSGSEYRYRFATDDTVEELMDIAGAPVSLSETEPAEDANAQQVEASLENGSKESIAERVRFWEEQDKINQALIPRVIRQNELLTKHIAEHDNLPEVAGRAISQALAEAREEQRGHYEAALEAAERKIAETAQATNQALADAREEQREQYETALAAAKRELAENAQTSLNQALGAMKQEIRRTRNVLIAIAAGTAIIGVAALIVSLFA